MIFVFFLSFPLFLEFAFALRYLCEFRFGTVFKGLYKGNEVAVKTYSGLTFENNNSEANTFSKLHSPYVVTFYGICVSTNAMIIEFCKYGSVESCYKNKKLTDEVKLLMCYDCAMGMNVSFLFFLFFRLLNHCPSYCHRN